MMIKDRPEFESKPKPLTFEASTSVADAVREMSKLNYGSTVVVDAAGKPEGVVTERDIMKRLVNENRDPSSTTLGDIMTREVRVARETDDIADWLRIMSNERFRRVPVVDEQGKLTSLMTQGDFVSYTWPDLINQAKEMTKATLSTNTQVVVIAGGIAAYTLLMLVVFRFV